MATLTGLVLSAMQRAERLPLAGAAPASAPGWYTLELPERDLLLFVGETVDLAARLAWHRQLLDEQVAVDPAGVYVRWVEAPPILGAQAWTQRARRAIDGVLVSIMQPAWDADVVAA